MMNTRNLYSQISRSIMPGKEATVIGMKLDFDIILKYI